jgi:hypothetical protein
MSLIWIKPKDTAEQTEKKRKRGRKIAQGQLAESKRRKLEDKEEREEKERQRYVDKLRKKREVLTEEARLREARARKASAGKKVSLFGTPTKKRKKTKARKFKISFK